jgi:cell division protein FtsQ
VHAFARWLPFAAALAGVVVFCVATDGGRQTRQARPLIEAIDRLAEAAGLGLSEIRVAGHVQTDDKDVFEALRIANVHSLLGFDAKIARTRIEQLPWVRSATIQRSFPQAVSVTIAERIPFAIWDHAGRRQLIDDSGRVLGAAPPVSADLPVVAGDGAPGEAAQLFSVVSAHPNIQRRLTIAKRIEGRRWSLALDGGLTVHLPAEGVEDALWRLTMPRAGGSLIDRSLAVVDLRLPSQIIVTPSAIAPVAGLDATGVRGTLAGGTSGGGLAVRSE